MLKYIGRLVQNLRYTRHFSILVIYGNSRSLPKFRCLFIAISEQSCRSFITNGMEAGVLEIVFIHVVQRLTVYRFRTPFLYKQRCGCMQLQKLTNKKDTNLSLHDKTKFHRRNSKTINLRKENTKRCMHK